MPRPATIRSLASQLGLSTATISEALRDSERVKPETRERVQRAAREAGYERNPLLGATFSALRRSRHLGFNGTIGLVDVAIDDRTELMLFHQEVVRGATKRAQELGFRTELFWVGRTAPALSVTRLNNVLFARGIPGVIFLPFDQRQDFSRFDFSQIAAVGMDHRLSNPSLHTVQPDHYLSMHHAVAQLTAHGYRRIGLCLEARKDSRVDHKWSAGFLSQFREKPKGPPVPPLIAETLHKGTFTRWFRRYRPDVIVGHGQVVIDWLRALKISVPEDVGFFRINTTERSDPCAGLDLRPHLLGATAVESVVAMLHRREHGIPRYPKSISVDAIWSDGPTIRPERKPRASRTKKKT
ncbi:LacI family DNA-binding transcriptional regulator [Actomonas aquatica]|uniref:LacI family DNA-binding transcriptional regulator n=1 Tax=Actomonas aquatica TaxID=2866162 RepID=A0ABZ1C972_9BACT|nr:LacI family DNA-binding transcriptional regulator [Opitutus sp. WL0086]WRQ87847.1 LacI family DNA-binding transcriptional regulator [Opitutus sp. WL0086]